MTELTFVIVWRLDVQRYGGRGQRFQRPSLGRYCVGCHDVRVSKAATLLRRQHGRIQSRRIFLHPISEHATANYHFIL